jgi:hypothetical protein
MTGQTRSNEKECLVEQRSGSPAAEFFMPIELGAVQQFARATKFAPSVRGDAGRLVSPPTFLISCQHWQGEEHSPWGGSPPDFERLLHGAQEFVFHGPPPRAGDELIGQARIDQVYEKQGARGGVMTFTEIVTEFHDRETGRLVAESRTTCIETSQAVTS